MPKWIAIRASAVITIAGSVITVFFSGFLAIAVLLTPPRETGPLPPGVMKIAGVAVAVFFAGGAAWGVCSGIGIFRRRNWARMSMVAFAGLLVFLGAAGVLASLLLTLGASPDIDRHLASMLGALMIAFYSVLAALGAWWLVLFTRRPAMEYFAAPEAAPDAPPMSINFIAWYLLSSALLTALAAVLRFPTELFGFVLGGWAAAAIYTLYTAAQIYLGAGLLQLDNKARWWSIVYFCAIAANGIAIAISPGFRDKAQEFALNLEGYSRMEVPDLGNGWWLAIASVVSAAVPIWFLVRRRAAFVRGELAQ